MARRWLLLFAAFLLELSSVGSAAAQSAGARPSMTKIDPPNWWVDLPKPMLLIEGEHLSGATFSLSDGTLELAKTHVSANGHWAELWLKTSPATPETITIAVQDVAGRAELPFTFAARREENDGFAGFSSKDVMYLIMTDRFADGDLLNNAGDDRSKPRGWHGGDLRGIIEHLDYLQDLGVTTVWITPVYQNHEDQSYHGYGATDMYAVDEHFGSLADLKALADALHKRGMKLVLDTVPNHVGQGHVWAKDPPQLDWLHGTKAHHRVAQGDFRPLVDPHAPWRDRRDVTEGWFANILPDLNQENPDVAEYLTQNAVWWIEETGADGLRLDTFPYVGREFWHDYLGEIHALYPHVTAVGEVFTPDATIASAFASGVTRSGMDTGLDTPFDYPSFFALRDVLLRGAPMSKLADVWGLDALYPHPERLVPFEGNHDVTRFMGEPGATLAKLKLAFAVLLTMRGMPEIYSGDEIAMTGGGDPDNRRDFPGGFSGDGQNNAFDAASRTPAEAEMHDWVKGLLDLRRTHAPLMTGDEQVLRADRDVLIYVRGARLDEGCSKDSGERVAVAVNKGDRAAVFNLPIDNTALERCGAAKVLLGVGASFHTEGDSIRVEVPAGSALVATFE